MTRSMRARRVLFVLPNRVQIMDVAGPAQVFTNASELRRDSYQVSYYAASAQVVSHQGLVLGACTDWPALQAGDLIVVPGWKTERESNPFDPDTLQRIKHHWVGGGHVASICAGALALAQTGIIDGHRATTHHDLIGELARYRNISVVGDVLFTCEDRLHTSAGIASGVDLAIHLVAHDHGPAIAAKVARTLVVAGWRPGNTSQVSVMLTHRNHMDDLTHRAQDILDDLDHDPGTLEQLAKRLGVSGRTLARHFQAHTGHTPATYLAAVRLERATQLRAQGWTWEAAARAVGYADARSLRSSMRGSAS